MEELEWWRTALKRPFCGMPVREIPEAQDVVLYVDASTAWGIGLTIGSEWDHWNLATGWKCQGWDIGWAEKVAAELGLRALIERGYRDVHIRLWSDNKGIVGALDAVKSRGIQATRVLQWIVLTMLENGIWLSLAWVVSEDNPVDAPSRGTPLPGMIRKKHSFKLLFVLRDLVLLVDE